MIITTVFVINENVHHSLILLVCGYLLIYNMQQFSHYKKWCLCPIFCEIAQKRIRYIVERQLSENQIGFRKNKGCSDAIFILRQLQEKHIEWNKPLYMAFIDQEKAFDRVVRAEVWKCLAERGIIGELLRAIQSLYICSQAAVRTREGETMVRSEMWIKTRMCVVTFVIHNIYQSRARVL